MDNPQVLLRAATAVLKLLQHRILACKTQVHDCIYMRQLFMAAAELGVAAPVCSCAKRARICAKTVCGSCLWRFSHLCENGLFSHLCENSLSLCTHRCSYMQPHVAASMRVQDECAVLCRGILRERRL